MEKEFGGEMLMERLKNCERAVAEAPIIWFITSQIAPMFISSITNSRSEKSVCRSSPTMIFTSDSFRIRIFCPSRPFT